MLLIPCILIQFGELAVIIDDKLTGKPRRDPVSGVLQNHHLGNSDVSLQVFKLLEVMCDNILLVPFSQTLY